MNNGNFEKKNNVTHERSTAEIVHGENNDIRVETTGPREQSTDDSDKLQTMLKNIGQRGPLHLIVK